MFANADHATWLERLPGGEIGENLEAWRMMDCYIRLRAQLRVYATFVKVSQLFFFSFLIISLFLIVCYLSNHEARSFLSL
jgi:hypothetical protein